MLRIKRENAGETFTTKNVSASYNSSCCFVDDRDILGGNAHFQQNRFTLNKDTLPFARDKLHLVRRRGENKVGSHSLRGMC